MLAHELRNPLAAIGNAASLMAMTDGRQNTVDYSEDIIRRQTKHLSQLIDDLLDVSHISLGKISFAGILERTSILDSAVETVRTLADEGSMVMLRQIAGISGSTPIRPGSNRSSSTC